MNDLDVRKFRESLGISVAELANRLGVAEQTVRNWEQGGTIPATKVSMLKSIIGVVPNLNSQSVISPQGGVVNVQTMRDTASVNNACTSSALEKAIDELSAQRKLTEAANALTKQSQDMLAEAQSAIIKLTQAIIDIKHNGDNQ